jgi:hypothetical protein
MSYLFVESDESLEGLSFKDRNPLSMLERFFELNTDLYEVACMPGGLRIVFALLPGLSRLR